jgi:hypothetical protein
LLTLPLFVLFPLSFFLSVLPSHPWLHCLCAAVGCMVVLTAIIVSCS